MCHLEIVFLRLAVSLSGNKSTPIARKRKIGTALIRKGLGGFSLFALRFIDCITNYVDVLLYIATL